MNRVLGSVQVHVNFSKLHGVDNEYQVMCWMKGVKDVNIV